MDETRADHQINREERGDDDPEPLPCSTSAVRIDADESPAFRGATTRHDKMRTASEPDDKGDHPEQIHE
ncbi:hypothetical protein [Xaviernesmea oryzae]|uniref:hypothetical protein n=1 Tax=Xaviernesmea oryzae TaxID=464029 RepID=UPI001F34DEB4|nr:hypothetical protein [Xaviernesmea oryzae]